MNKDTKFQPFTVLISGTGGQHLRETETVFERSAKFRVRSVAPAKIPALEDGVGVDAAVLSIETLGEDEFALLNEVRAKFGRVPIVVLSDHLDDGHVRRLIKFGVHDWLTRPVEDAALLKSVQTGVRNAKTSSNMVHAVVSGEGGAGATVVAASMAGLLMDYVSKHGETVALFDLDFSTGSTGYALNMVNTYDLNAVATHPERIDVEFTNLIREKHPRGFYIYSFKQPGLITDPNGYELVLRMLDAVNVQHDHTVLDVPYYETDWRADALSAVNTCTIVTELNLPALKQALDSLKTVRALRGNSLPVRILVNKIKSGLFGGGISAKDLKDLFGNTPVWRLPYDDRLISESLNRGVLPAEISGRSGFVRSLRDYMESLLEEAEARQ